MQQWTLSTSSALMDCMEPGAFSAQSHYSHWELGLTSALWIHTGLVTFSIHKLRQEHPVPFHKGIQQDMSQASIRAKTGAGALGHTEAVTAHYLHSNKTLRGCGEPLFA